RPCNSSWTIDMNGLEVLFAAFVTNAHQIDHDISARNSATHRVFITQIGLDWHDLPDGTRSAHDARQIGATYGHTDAIAFACQQLHDMRPDKSGTAENRDQFGDIASHRHHSCDK